MHMGQNSLFLVAENLAPQTEQTRLSRAAKSACLPGLSRLSLEFVFMARSILQRALRPRKVRESRRRRRRDLRPYGQSPHAPKPYIACASDGPRSLPPPRRSVAQPPLLRTRADLCCFQRPKRLLASQMRHSFVCPRISG